MISSFSLGRERVRARQASRAIFISSHCTRLFGASPWIVQTRIIAPAPGNPS